MFSSIKFFKSSQFRNTLRQNASFRLFASNNKHDNHISNDHSHHHTHQHDQNAHNKHDTHSHGDHHDHHGAVEHHDHHDHHGHHDHHEITGEVDLGRVYVPLSKEFKNHRFIALSGIPSDNTKIRLHYEGEWKAHNAITPIAIPFFTQSRKKFKRLANVPDEDNPYFHSEPYGYLFSDDPFDPNPSLWQRSIPLILIFLGLYITVRSLRQTNNKDHYYTVEKIFHAHYMAGLLEDEIRQIRQLDYPYRKKYEEMKNGNSEEKTEENVSKETD